MNKYKVEFNLNAQKKGKPKYDFIFGQTENSALEDAGLTREQIVGIYLLGAEEPTVDAVPDASTEPAQDDPDGKVSEPVSPSVQGEPTFEDETPEQFSGGGSDFN